MDPSSSSIPIEASPAAPELTPPIKPSNLEAFTFPPPMMGMRLVVLSFAFLA
jgi:hypothetical protein